MINVFWPKNSKVVGEASFTRFLNALSARIAVGQHRYCPPAPEKRYMRRIGLEFAAYRRTGNMEHLINIANYCWLESEAPEHPEFHNDSTAGSVTRGKV